MKTKNLDRRMMQNRLKRLENKSRREKETMDNKIMPMSVNKEQMRAIQLEQQRRQEFQKKVDESPAVQCNNCGNIFFAPHFMIKEVKTEIIGRPPLYVRVEAEVYCTNCLKMFDPKSVKTIPSQALETVVKERMKTHVDIQKLKEDSCEGDA